MPARLFAHLAEIKVLAVGGASLVVMATDAMANLPVESWESMGLKTALIVAIVYLARQNAQLSKEAKEDRAAQALIDEKRETRIVEVIAANTAAKDEHTKALHELRASTEAQTGYFKTVAQTLINRTIKPNLPD